MVRSRGMRNVVVGLTCLLGGSAAQAATCATRAEIEALQMRHLQSRFVVAALSCGQQQAYNAFVARFQPELAISGQQLIGYYRKAKGGTAALNEAVTELANAAAKLRAEDPQGFCTTTWNLFWSLDRKPERLTDAAAENLMYAVPMPSQCQDPPVVSADSSRTVESPAETVSRPVPVK